MNFVESFFWYIIKLSHGPELALISILGFLFINRKAFGLVIFITIFTMAFNAYLKSIWQVPLNPEIGKIGWSFPSGHTQASAVFWFMLALLLGKMWMVVITPIVMLGVVFGIVHFGYHDWPDVLAALSFAGLEIIFFHYFIKLFDYFKIPYYWLGFITSFAVILIINFYLPPAEHNYTWLKWGLGATIGISLGWMIVDKLGLPQVISNNKLLCLLLLGTLGTLFALLIPHLNFGQFDELIKVTAIGMTISYGIPLLDSKMTQYKKRDLKIRS